MKLIVSASIFRVFIIGFLIPISPAFAQKSVERPLPTIWLSQVISASELPIQGQTKLVASGGNGHSNIELTLENFNPKLNMNETRYWMVKRLSRSTEKTDNEVSFKAPSHSRIIQNVVEDIYAIYGKPDRENDHEKIWNISNPNWETGQAKIVTLKLIEMANGQTLIVANAPPFE